MLLLIYTMLAQSNSAADALVARCFQDASDSCKSDFKCLKEKRQECEELSKTLNMPPVTEISGTDEHIAKCFKEAKESCGNNTACLEKRNELCEDMSDSLKSINDGLQETENFVQEINSSSAFKCGVVMMQYCPSSTNQEQCLSKYLIELLEEKDCIEPLTMIYGRDYFMIIKKVANVCKNDIKKYCTDSSKDIISCLKENSKNLSSECQSEYKKI